MIHPPLSFGSANHTVTLRHGLALAPLAGVSDRAFRRVCRALGADYTVSEMVSAKALCYEQRSRGGVRSVSGQLASVRRDEVPMAVQLFGHEPEFMAEAARMLESNDYRGCTSEVPPSAIDINMGCPVRKVTGNGEGSALLRTPALAGEIVRAVVRAVSLPVTVKIRAGWDKDSINAPEIAKICEEWCTERDLVQKLQISLNAIMEAFHEHNPQTQLKFKIWYDQLQIKLDVKSDKVEITQEDWSEENLTTISVSLMMLRNMFDNVKITQVEKSVLIHVDADI